MFQGNEVALQKSVLKLLLTEVYAKRNTPGTRCLSLGTVKHQVYANHSWMSSGTGSLRHCALSAYRDRSVATDEHERLELVRRCLLYQSRRAPKPAVQGYSAGSAA